ncbi:hypothetical protein GCM10027614_38610 [Micromonospora vulcania]
MARTRSPLRRVLAAGLTVLATAAATLVATAGPAAAATTPGIDVSHYQGTINWTSVRNAGIQFAFIKATEGTSVKDSAFNANYVNSYNAGVIRGRTTSPGRTSPPARPRRTTWPPTAAPGRRTAAPCRPRWTSRPTRTAGATATG